MKQAPKSQVPPNLPPPPPPPPADFGLHAMKDLKKKSQCTSLRRKRWSLKRGPNNRKWPRTPRIGGPLPSIAERNMIWPRYAFHNEPGPLGWRWMGFPYLGMPLSGSSKRSHSQHVAEALQQPLLLPKDMDVVRKLKQHDLFMSLKRDLAMVSPHPQTFHLF